MDTAHGNQGDSRIELGGDIPGHGGAPAWYQRGAAPSPIPVMLAVPHAGRSYPEALIASMRNPAFAALRLEDRYVDRLGEVVAAATGATLLVACAPRAMIDLNRAVDDVDWGMFGDGPADDVGSYTPGRRARSGLGLIPRRLPGIGELWTRRLDSVDLATRIAHIHEPYHRQLGHSLGAVRARWGAALLIDLHSMPPLRRPGGPPGPDFVVGDRFGASCTGALVASAFAHFAAHGHSAAHNRPYAGGYVLERHAAPALGIHAMQIEIDRSRYLDSRLAEPGEGFAATVAVLVGLVRRLAGDVAALGTPDTSADWAEAAE